MSSFMVTDLQTGAQRVLNWDNCIWAEPTRDGNTLIQEAGSDRRHRVKEPLTKLFERPVITDGPPQGSS